MFPPVRDRLSFRGTKNDTAIPIADDGFGSLALSFGPTQIGSPGGQRRGGAAEKNINCPTIDFLTMQESGRVSLGGMSVSLGNPWLFFGVTYAVTWSFLLLAIALGVSFQSAEGVVLQLLALLGPGAAGIGFVYLVYGDRGRADFWNRIKQPRRIGVRWFLVILLVPVGVTIVATVGASLLGGPGVAWGEAVRELGSDPLAILPTLFFATLPPILEEFGWRGYAVNSLGHGGPRLL